MTTLVVGQDGESWIGATEETARYLNQYFAPVNGALAPLRSLTVSEYREAVSGRLTQNVAVLASQGTIRHNLVGLAPGHSGQTNEPRRGRRLRTRWQTGRSGCPAGWITCPAGSAASRRSLTWPGRWRRRDGHMSRTFAHTAPRSGLA